MAAFVRPPGGGWAPPGGFLRPPGGGFASGGIRAPINFVEEDRGRDWKCTYCNERNFAKRQDCFKCKAPRSADAKPPVIKAPPPQGTTCNGMVKSYNKKGFGFIMCTDPGHEDQQDIWYTRDAVSSRLLHPDMPGEHVTFEIFFEGKRPCARNIRPLGEAKSAASNGHVFPSAAPGSKTAMSFGKGFEGEDRSRDWNCPKCKERNFLKRFECHKCRFPRPLSHGESLPSSTPRQRGVSPHAGSRAMAIAAMLGGKARNRSADSDSSESRSKKEKKEKKKKKRKRAKSGSSGSSSSKSARSEKKKKKKSRKKKSSSSSSSECAPEPEEDAADSSSAATGSGNPEVDAAKAKALEDMVKLRSIQPKETRMQSFRALLRKWHPDKNPDNQEVATAVFQFLQKGKPMLDQAAD